MLTGILTLSDRSARGQRPDAAGPIIADFVQQRLGGQIGAQAILPDEFEIIRATLLDWCDQRRLDLIFTTGGTGFAPRDVTPEATRAVLEREAPGLAEAMRADSLKITRHAMLSRAVCGMRGRTLIINLPGSPKAVAENLETLAPVLPHALALLQDAPGAEAQHRTA